MEEFIIKNDAKGFHVFLNITGDYMFSTDSMEKADKLIKCLDKTISKKTIYSPGTTSRRWNCPTCNRTYWEKDEIKGYCNSCGQRLVTD